MLTWDKWSNPQLDIVGIVAVLGEGSTLRNAQASALGWHHILPRLLPAPQALLKHERPKRLPTVPGTVVGAYSGNVSFELNFFCQLLHPDDLGKNEVQLVEIEHDTEAQRNDPYSVLKGWLYGNQKREQHGVNHDDASFFKTNEQAFGLNKSGPLVLLSVLGFLTFIGMLIGAYLCEDGFAFMATLCLAITSSLVGAASWWNLEFKEAPPKKSQKVRRQDIPDSDVVIYYPRQGAFRIVRCKSEAVARLYFSSETCHNKFGDTAYRVLALSASIFLMVGLLCMSNSSAPLQKAFAATYIALNALYWLSSASNPTSKSWGHWKHRYKCTTFPVILPTDTPAVKSPVRYNTQESFKNTPVRHQEPDSPTTATGVELQAMHQRTTIDSTKTANESIVQVEDGPEILGRIRQRRITFRDDVLMSGAAALEVDTSGSDQRSDAQNDTPVSPKAIVVSPTSLFGPGSLQKKPTVDLEGLNERRISLFGSVRDILKRWFGKPLTFSKSKQRTADADAKKPETFTTALWKAIVVTGSTRWLHSTHIAPDNEVWTQWIEQAGRRARVLENARGELVAAYIKDDQDRIVLPPWNYQDRLAELFALQAKLDKRRPQKAQKLYRVIAQMRDQHVQYDGMARWIELRLRRLAEKARRDAQQKRCERTQAAVSRLNPKPGIVVGSQP